MNSPFTVENPEKGPALKPSPIDKAYIDLLQKCLLGKVFQDYSILSRETAWKRWVQNFVSSRGYELLKRTDPGHRQEGKDWPMNALTMIGEKRTENLRFCVEDILKNNVPGDLIETGIWRGGACILMRGILKAYGVTNRKVWVADSFAGLPPPTSAMDKKWSNDHSADHDILAVSLEDVQDNFARFDLLDSQVKFIKGWFKDTLHHAPIESLAVARLDGDLYDSTMDAIKALYPKLSLGGYLIVDDYKSWESCQKAIDEYRLEHHIGEKLVDIDVTGVFWKKENPIS